MKFVLFTLGELKVKEGGFIVKFVKVYEWFDGGGRLKIIFFKSRENKITKLSFIFKIIKSYYISTIYLEKILKCINVSNIF